MSQAHRLCGESHVPWLAGQHRMRVLAVARPADQP